MQQSVVLSQKSIDSLRFDVSVGINKGLAGLMDESSEQNGISMEAGISVGRSWYGASLSYSRYSRIAQYDYTPLFPQYPDLFDYQIFNTQTFKLQLYVIPLDKQWIRLSISIGAAGTFVQSIQTQYFGIHPDLNKLYSIKLLDDRFGVSYCWGFDLDIAPRARLTPFVRGQNIDIKPELGLLMLGAGVKINIR